MRRMFKECSSLKQLDLSNFKTNHVTNMNGMFMNCRNLKELNISNFFIFNSSNDVDIDSIFDGCQKLKNLICSSKEILKIFRAKYTYPFA